MTHIMVIPLTKLQLCHTVIIKMGIFFVSIAQAQIQSESAQVHPFILGKLRNIIMIRLAYSNFIELQVSLK